jgi:hypothetical protein
MLMENGRISRKSAVNSTILLILLSLERGRTGKQLFLYSGYTANIMGGFPEFIRCHQNLA